MAETWFTPKEWKARLVEFAGRRLLRNVASGQTATYDVSRSEGQISQEGDAFNTKNMNDLEQRISNGFANAKTNIDALNRDLGRVNVYVGGDGKIHFVNSGGADSVLPFSAGMAYKGVFSDSDGNRGNAVTVDLKQLIDWWKDVNLSVAVITNVSADNNIQSFSYATTKYDKQTGILTINQSGGSRTFSGNFVVAKAGEGTFFV